MSEAQSYRNSAAECLRLARTAYSADARRNLATMAAERLALAERVEGREVEARRFKSAPEPLPAPNAAAGQPVKPKERRTARKSSLTGTKVSVQRERSTRAAKSRA
jgi:hypothetical protein